MYLSQSTYDAIRNDPSKVVDYYNLTQGTFIADLEMSGLSEAAVKAAWCSVVAYGLSPYGPGPGTYSLPLLLQSPTLECSSYVTLTWHLYSHFGFVDDNLTAVGWDNGAVGNHAQMLYSDGTTNLLLDPTIGLVVKDVSYLNLVYGQSYTDFKSFYSRSDITHFNDKVISAITSGTYRVWDTIYKVPEFDNWVNNYWDHTGVTIEHGNNSQTIVGYVTGDRIDAGIGNDTIYGGKGNDALIGGGGEDAMYGGVGDDRFYVDNSRDVVYEEWNGGNDIVYLSGSNYVLGDNIENAYINSLGIASVKGNSLGNIIFSGPGNNSIDARDGVDTVSYYYSTSGVSVKLSLGYAQNTQGSGYDTLISVENLSGSEFNDLLMGNWKPNRLVGSGGDDALNGLSGADTMIGGNGSDRYYIHDAKDVVIETNATAGTGGVDTIYSYLSTYWLPNNIEVGRILNVGTATLTGNALSNTLYGNVGANVLNGRMGVDTLTGGAGADKFLFDTLLRWNNIDTITDFLPGIDKILVDEDILAGLGFAGTSTGAALPSSKFHTGSTAHDTDDRFVYNASSGALYYDADGSGVGVQSKIAQLGIGAHPILLSTDIFIVS